MARFNIIPRGGQYYFQFMANNGEQILASEGYTTKQNCKNGIDAVKRFAPHDYVYDRFDNYLNYRFNMSSINNRDIARSSEGYVSRAGRENAIEVVKAYAPTAPVYDLTI
jgi:uncharacterized protein YegP (UPF0339 family)